VREQLVAAHMHAGEHLDGFSLVDANGKTGPVLYDEVHLAVRQQPG
jgi:hypothetical protein